MLARSIDELEENARARREERLLQLLAWLESNGEDSAATSLREGLDETLTVLRLGLPPVFSVRPLCQRSGCWPRV